MIGRLLIAACLIASHAYASDSANKEVIILLKNIEINPDTSACRIIDKALMAEYPLAGWTTTFDYIHGYLDPTYGNHPVEQKYKWTVSKNGSLKDRKMFSLVAWKGGLWRENGRIEVGLLCGDYELRRTDKFSYRYAVNKAGMPGLTACELTPVK